uniref:Uncharacterized protein n=1 Tax=Oryza brachyantha TaxID=4533 RepID=J3M9F3_ORYBR
NRKTENETSEQFIVESNSSPSNTASQQRPIIHPFHPLQPKHSRQLIRPPVSTAPDTSGV